MVEQKIKKKKINQEELNLALIENFAMMQKSLANLTVKFDTLSDNISKLLQLFEISARTFIRKQEGALPMFDSKEDKEMLTKLDSLLEQNKTIAKGLTLIEEKIRHKITESPARELISMEHGLGEKPRPKPLPHL